MKTNKHNLKMNGLKSLSGKSKNLNRYSGEYIQVNYDKITGDVWGNYFCCFGHNSWAVYNDVNVLNCGNIDRRTTMQDLADMIALADMIDSNVKNQQQTSNTGGAKCL